MNYQELVNACKKSFADKDLKSAYDFWSKIYDLLDKNLENFNKDDEINRFKCYQEFHDYMKQFTDDEVYKITDYGKEKEYKKMEIERTYSILDKSIKCSELDDMKEMKSLDDFLDFYEWCILKSENNDYLYNIYDLQTNEIIDSDENNGDKTLNETILRVVDKALCYELDETEFETDEEYEEYEASDYIQDLVAIQDEFIDRRKEELEKEIDYEERKFEVCGYGKSDLYYIENLKLELEELEER